MIRTAHRIAICCLALFAAAGAHAADASREPPLLAAAVAKGALPPLDQRIPETPRVIDLPAMARTPGQYGGVLRLLMGDQRDIRMVTIYSYARLVVFNEKGELEPDILESFDVKDGRVFTLKIRKGHKWSDGQPFTAEDFRYFWEDVANNSRLYPSGPPFAMVAGEKPAKFEIVDPLTVRFTWDAPNPAFLPALAGAQPTQIVMPAHYLKQFHQKYADPKQLAEAVKAARFKDWGSLHERKARWYRPENPELPVLDPWRNTTAPPAELFTFERNPYFHRVDNLGRQLPYIDRLTVSIGTSSLVPAKIGAGEGDLQARYIRFDNYTFLKESQKRQGYKVKLWTRGEGAWVALLPNLNTGDLTWRALVRDTRFRQALSVGINRRDINQAIFFGLGKESADTVIPGSVFYTQELQNAWAQHDPALANRLLDEIGLSKRDHDGVRLLPDGRRAELTIDATGESTEETDVLELISYQWMKIGIRMFARSSQRDVFRRRALAGQSVMSISVGMDNGTPGPDMEPTSLAPAHYLQYQWPLWGQYVQNRGQQGEKPEGAAVLELIRELENWRSSRTTGERAEIWRRMLKIHAEQVFTIGIVNRTSQPLVVSSRLRNVPDEAIYSFEPGAFFGAYLPDTFWFEPAVSN